MKRVDTIEQKKTILILRGKGAALSAAENFLRNREWKIYSTDNLKEALVHIVQHKPAFVLVNIDHPNKKVRSLPKILTQAFPVCVMAFAESSSAASFSLLSSSGTDYVLYPPVTGPAIERTVNKYYKDLATKPTSSNGDKWENSDEAKEAMISIKGSQSGMMNFKGDASAQNLFAQLMGEESSTSDTSSGSAGFIAGDSMSQTSGAQSGIMGSGSTGNGSGAAGWIPSGPGSTADGSSNGAAGYVPSGHSSAQTGSQGSVGPYGNHSGQGGPAGAYDGGSGHGPHGSSSGSEGESGTWRRKKDAGGGWVPMDTPPSDDKIRGGSSTGFQRTHEDSIILRGTKEALEKSVISSKHVHSAPMVQKIEQSSNVACIIVESPRFSGYLVTAMGKNRKIDDQFLKGVHERLFKFLRDNGESVKQEETMNIKIRQVPFEDWAMDCAEFLRKSVHDGDEVAMAFFPYLDAKMNLEDSHHSDMASIRLNDLKGDVEVEMNLYVYLPANKKYVLYTPRGGKFYGAQKDRLARQGVTHMHMLKMEVDDLNKYRAQNYLNDKIEEFESRQREKKKVG